MYLFKALRLKAVSTFKNICYPPETVIWRKKLYHTQIVILDTEYLRQVEDVSVQRITSLCKDTSTDKDVYYLCLSVHLQIFAVYLKP